MKEKIFKKYWKKVGDVQEEYWKAISKLEKKMNKELKKYKLPELEIFHVEGDAVGIGAVTYSDRENFELIHGGNLE